MALTMLLLYLMGLLCGEVAHTRKSPHQKAVYLTVNIGGDLAMQCPHDKQIYKYYWYKQSPGELPTLVSNIYLGANNGVLENEFKTDARFKLSIDKHCNYLNISGVQLSDSATYFCTTSSSMNFDFVQSITVFVRGAEAVVQQSLYEDAEPGRSVVLNCSVVVGGCGEQHTVHWFKQSGESAAGVLYSRGGSDGDRCEKTAKSPTKSCVYSLPIHNVSSEQTGTYYCAVAACGQVLFGNGTKLTVEAASETVNILTGALMLTTSLLFSVTFCLCCRNTAEPPKPDSASSTKGKGFPKVAQYKAADVTAESRRRMDETWSECIYFSVEQ